MTKTNPSIQRMLSKPQGRVFIALAQQRAELQAAFQEVLEAEREQIEMLRRKYDLPEGLDYQVRQEADGALVLFGKEKKAKEEAVTDTEAKSADDQVAETAE